MCYIQKMSQHLIHPRGQIFVKGYGVLSLVKISKKRLAAK